MSLIEKIPQYDAYAKITLVFLRSRQFTLIMETVPIYDLDPDITSLIEKIPQYDAYAKITFVFL